MAEQEIVKQNFSGGELSEKMYGRPELQVFNNGCRREHNFTTHTQGGAEFDNGTMFVNHTRLNKVANLITFEFNDEQAYGLEFTDQYLRFYKDSGVVLESTNTITNITAANPPVVTAGTHGYSNGDEVFITGVVGMTEVNDLYYLVANKTATTFELTDIDGNNVDGTAFTAYSSAGTAARVYEIATPYTEANDLFQLKWDQDADTMQIAHPFYLPRELTRTSDTAWTLTLPSRTGTPFTDQQTITGITQADPAVVTITGHTFSDGDTCVIETVSGMTEINSQPYLVANSTANTFELTDLDGVDIDSTGFTAYSSGGYASDQDLIPYAVAFYESRLWFGGTDTNPAKVFGSRSPDSSGDARYTDFTTGTDADHAVVFTIQNAGPNIIFWLAGTERMLLAGTYGSIIKITGADDELAITPTSVKARRLDSVGVQNIPPINKENFIQYVQKNGLTVKTLVYETLQDTFVAGDENIVSDDITRSGGDWSKLNATASATGIKQIKWETGRPDVAWAVRNDGLLLGLTYDPAEKVAAWHRHSTGASGEDKYLSVTTIPRPNNYDQVWFVSERTINSNTRRYVSYRTDTPVYPKKVDYFTGEDNKVADEAQWARALLESMKEYVHVHEALTYDGTAAGLDAGASVTPGATTGTGITFTASAAVFASTDVGREIWKRSIDGVGTGRAEITGFTNTTEVVCTILNGADFDDADAMAAGDWYLTTGSVDKLDHLEGRTVRIIADGGAHPEETVSSGSVTLDYQVSVAHIGIGYDGLLMPMTNEFGGETGPSVAKPKNITEFGFRFLNSLGAVCGTDLYNSVRIPFASMPLLIGSPQLLFTGVKRIPHIEDTWELDKLAYVRQDNPLPCIVQQMVIFGDTEES